MRRKNKSNENKLRLQNVALKFTANVISPTLDFKKWFGSFLNEYCEETQTLGGQNDALFTSERKCFCEKSG